MIKHSKSLSRKVESYIKFLIKPNPKTGQPICPGLAPYRHEIHVLMAQDDIESQIEHVADLLIPLDIPAAVIYTGLPPTDLIEICDRVLNEKLEIEIFVNEPHLTGSTGFKSGTLIIIQRLDLLEKSRKNAKKAGYYVHNQKAY